LGEISGAPFFPFSGELPPALGLLFRLDLFAERSEAAEKQLREEAEGHGVLAVDAVVGDLADEIGDEGIHLPGGREVAGVGEQLGGQGFVVGLGRGGLLEMMGTEGFVVRSAKHAAALAAGTDVMTLSSWLVLPGHKSFLSG
jgi:hypothetical protein